MEAIAAINRNERNPLNAESAGRLRLRRDWQRRRGGGLQRLVGALRRYSLAREPAARMGLVANGLIRPVRRVVSVRF